ncbi:zinc finger, CCHC-type containing protein [Tanacetum coccineum]
MVRPKTVKLQILYWTTYIEYGWSDLRPEAYDGVKHATRQYNSGLYFPMAATAQNTNNTTIKSEGKLVHLEQPLSPLPYPEVSQAARDAYDALLDAQNEVACLMLAYDMIQELKTMFEEQAKQELMKSYLDTLERLGYAMPKELGVSLILNSLNKDYDQFVQNYNMHSIGKTLAELHDILKLHEKGEKGKGKGKNKLAYDLKPKIPPPPKREHPAKDSVYHHCKEMGNGMRAAVEAIKSFDLILPSGLIIVLDNYHFAPTVTRSVVLISRLVNNGYIHTFTNYGIFVSKDNVFYFNAIPRDGIYEIDMRNLYPNVSSMYNVSNKRAKHGLDSYYLWHCHLGHINKKRMDMLQRDGLLQPTHDESHEKCKSCISGKMARKPFPHQVERVKDL